MAELVPLLARLLATGKESSPFAHYLFEALAALASSVCSADARHAASFEAALLPHFNAIMSGSVEDLMPYALQKIALLIRVRPAEPIPAAYDPVIDSCLSYEPVEQRSLAPYVSEIICEYVRKCGPLLPISRVIKSVQTLMRSNAIVESAFRIIQYLFFHVDLSIVSELVPVIITDMIKRYEARQKRLIALPMIASLSVLTIKHGAEFTLRALDHCQPGCSALFLRQVWAPTLLRPASGMEYKHVVLGTTLLIGHPPLHSDPATWAALVGGLTALCFHRLSSTKDIHNATFLPPEFNFELQGNRLLMIDRPKLDAAPAATDPPERLFVRAMQSICTAMPAFAMPAIRASCGQETWDKLQKLLSTIK